MQCTDILADLRKQANPENVAGMARFGINTNNTLGISVAALRQMAKEIKPDHALALELWDSGIHEARLLATLIDIHTQVTEEQMEKWALDFDSWDICDLCCNNLFRKTEIAHQKAVQWSKRPKEFVKRAGFVMMAVLAVHDKRADDSVFVSYLPIITEASSDERNFVKKAINWALRQIGKRNAHLNAVAIETANELLEIDSKSARWIAKDSIKELTSAAVRKKLHKE